MKKNNFNSLIQYLPGILILIYVFFLAFTQFSAAVIAAIKPAAPPPITAKSKGSKNLLFNMLQSDNSKELQRKITSKTTKTINK